VITDPAGHVAVWEALETLGADVGIGELNFEGTDTPPTVGAFAFDYSGPQAGYGQYSPGQTYRRTGSPLRAVTRDQVTPSARSFLESVCFRDACFANVDALLVEGAFDAIHRPTAWDGFKAKQR
jgi:hypothetical protein